ncbi:MAG: hypothetical protein OJF55_001358 [Rhodanobacteraceae bacterium]|jgi:hypothetical protein|nr:MAG: hypothetical protein OJF55_001358 [Rhodanobacteraceae bacterium]
MSRRFELALAMLALVFSACAFGASSTSEVAAGAVTVPMQVELNRPYIDVALIGPTGRHVTAHAYVDTGGGALILAAGLAQRLGLQAQGAPLHEEGQTLQPTVVPSLRIGGKPVDLVDARALIASDDPHALHHTDAELALPGRYLRHYIVVFDYPARTFTLANPKALQPDGVAVRASVGGAGMPVVWASVAGKSYGFLMDTGGQYCMISQAKLDAWSQHHPQWESVSGAYGPANMLLGQSEAKLRMLRLASMQWGPFHIEDAGAVSRRAGTYEKWMSNMLGAPVIGSIAGNVLDHFKVTLDYPAGKVYLAGPAKVRDAPIDMVGVMLEPAAQGGYEVAGTIGTKDIEVGDRLLKADGHDIAQLPFWRIAELLGGTPGTTHALTLQRGPESLRVHATVRPIL